jgi:IPT/TIG domain
MKIIAVTALSLAILLTVAAPHASSAPLKKVPKKTVPASSKEDPVTPYTILSIIPSQGEPGKRVSLMGAGFSADTLAWLGTTAVLTAVISDRQIEFEVPRVDPGLYALYLKRPDGVISKIYNFPILALKPAIDAITPDTVFGCAPDQERLVTLSGRNFQESSALLFDGGTIRSSYSSPETLSFTVPHNVLGGQHNIQVKNLDDIVSGTVAFYIDMKPVIHAVHQGEERVNSYELILEGHNFQQGSSVVVDGRQIYNNTDRDKSRFVNCARIVYERFPYDRSTKSLKIQVVNPNGEESPIVTVSAP